MPTAEQLAPAKYGVEIITALNHAWEAIRNRHINVPPVVIITGTGHSKRNSKWGHFHAERWAQTTTTTELLTPVEGGLPVPREEKKDHRHAELFIAGELLTEGGRRTMQTVLHEAAHGTLYATGDKTCGTTGNGRYHNKKFAVQAEEMGLIRPPKAAPGLGFSECLISDETAEEYAHVIEMIDRANLPNLGRMPGLDGPVGPAPGRGRAGKRFAVECECQPPRRLQITPAALDKGSLICGVCEERFCPVEV